MTERKKSYPDTWQFAHPRTLEEIKEGDRFPAALSITGTCWNCQDCDRMMYSYLVVKNGPAHWFDDKEGNDRKACAVLQSMPCPVCNQATRVNWLERHSGLFGVNMENKSALSIRLSAIETRKGQSKAIETSKILLSEMGNPPRWLLLYGPNGSGKTHILCALVNGFRVANLWAMYSTSENILRKLRAAYNGSTSRQADEIRVDYESADVLIIDEIDRVKWTDWAAEQLFGIIETRHMAGRSTYFASNKTPTELREMNSSLSAIVSRMSAGWLVGVNAEDQRLFAWQEYAD